MKNVGRAGDAARVRARDVVATRSAWRAAAQVLGEAVDVEPELLGVAAQVARRRARPGARTAGRASSQKRALRARRLGRLGGQLGVRVDVGERQVAEDVAQVVAARASAARGSIGSAWPQYGHSKSPYSTQGDRRVVASPRMWSRSGSTSSARSMICSAVRRELAGAHRVRDAARAPGRSRRRSAARRSRGAEHAELGLVELGALEREAGDQQRDGEADAGRRRPSRPGRGQVTAQPRPPRARSRGQPRERRCRAACRPRRRRRSRS